MTQHYDFDDLVVGGINYIVEGTFDFKLIKDGCTSKMGDQNVNENLDHYELVDFTIDWLENADTEEEIEDPSMEIFEALKTYLEKELENYED